jgi:hypothetical protein
MEAAADFIMSGGRALATTAFHKVCRDPDTREVQQGWVLQIVGPDGSVSYA